MKKYFLFAGEASGDLHGSHLMRALQLCEEGSFLSGVGGPRMRKEGLDCFIEMEQFQVMGFSDVLKALPRLWKLFYQVRNQILALQPDCVVLIDYPGFNLRLARSLRKKGFKGKLVHYICPTVWAHGANRIQLLAKNYDLLLTILPFESSYFIHTTLKVEYVGNPLVDTIQNHNYHPTWQAECGIPDTNEIIALFPGSRSSEIKRNIPLQLHSAALLKERYPNLKFALSCTPENLPDDLDKNQLKLGEDLFIVPPAYNYELMRCCHTAVAKSGTVTLELALHAIPTVVHYELSSFNYYIAKYILRLKLSHYCLVNILGQRTIYPEFIGPVVLAKDLYESAAQLYIDQTQRKSIQDSCDAIKHQLGANPSHLQAAQAIMRLTSC